MGGSSRLGAFLHLLMAFTSEGTPLGACWATLWTRDESSAETSREKTRRRATTPIAEKERQRWIEGLREARRVAAELSHMKCVCIADSEADIYELFAEPRGTHPVEWLVRACQDRAVSPEADAQTRQIRATVKAQPVLFTHEILVRGREEKTPFSREKRHSPRESRTTRVEVRATRVTLRGPLRPGGRLPDKAAIFDPRNGSPSG